jgi:hypothetical protein
LEKQLESIRREHDHTPVKMVNKVHQENMMSSMTPTTHLFSDTAGRKTNITVDDDLARASANPYDRHRKDKVARNISFELDNRMDDTATDRVRESYLVKSRLSRHLVDEYNPRQRDFIQIDQDKVHKNDVQYKLRNSQSPGKCMPTSLYPI